MTSPTLSIVTVAAFEESRLRRTLQSLKYLGATFEHITVVPKTDSLGSELWKNQALPPNFELIHDLGKGIYDAMNYGAQVSSGNWILFLNAGDEIVSDRNFERALSVLEKSTRELLIFRAQADWADEQVKNMEDFEAFVTFTSSKFLSHQSVAISRKLFYQLGGFRKFYKVSADTRMLVEAWNVTIPEFSDVEFALVELPNLARLNHRRARIENLKTALGGHSQFNNKIVSLFNLCIWEWQTLTNKVSQSVKSLIIHLRTN